MIIIPNESELLWEDKNAPDNLSALEILPSINNPIKKLMFNIPGLSEMQHSVVGLSSDNDSNNNLIIHYEAGLYGIFAQAGLNPQTQGLGTWGNTEMDAFANALVNYSGGNSSAPKYIMTDFEPSVLPGQEWKFLTFPSSQYQAKIKYISDKILQTYNRIYFDLFTSRDFTYDGVTLSYNGDVFLDLDREISVFDNLNLVTNVTPNTNFLMENGYSSVVYSNTNSSLRGFTTPSYEHSPMIDRYLSNLHSFFLLKALKPNGKIIPFTAAMSDKQIRWFSGARYKPNGLQGYIRKNNSLPYYDEDLVSDFIFLTSCIPQVVTQTTWGSEIATLDPVGGLKYATRNGQPACYSQDVGNTHENYEGTDNPPCPSQPYIPNSSRNAFIRGINLFLQNQDLFNNTQVDSFPAFQYKRSTDNSFTTIQSSNGSAFVRAYKYKIPFLIVWTNSTNKKFLCFQDVYAEPFEKVEFKVNINNVDYTFEAEGNNLFKVRFD